MGPLQIDHRSPPEAKIALFRSLFRGRDDVYPRRFESRRTGKSGYAPACANEWVQGICDKPRVKCADCHHRRLLPVTDHVIRWHLSGRDDQGADFVAGVYPMLLDESCFFLALDFDKAGWKEDALAVMETCNQLNLPAALEQSRSGNVQDGVDRPLAKLFVHVAGEFDPSSQGLERARSATEAFFYRRLETLPETAGRFQLNAELPICFDGWGKMEVDLLCREARLVVELDGGQHLSSEDAYRRDRRKDALLQEHGYFVLRFLARDVGKRLDDVLDTILRILSRPGLPVTTKL